MSKIVLGLPTAELARYSAFYPCVFALHAPEDAEVIICQARSANISENRNFIVERSLKVGADYIFFMDDDHIIPQDTLIKLISHDKEIVSGLYTQREPPFLPHLFDKDLGSKGFRRRGLTAKDEGLIKVLAVPAGCLLVKTSIFERIARPYWTLGQINGVSWSDDLDFCRRCTAAGIPIYCDLEARVGHILNGVVWPQRAEEGWMAAMTVKDNAGLAMWPIPDLQQELEDFENGIE